MSTRRPQALPTRSEHIPAALRDQARWVCWRYEVRNGKPTKVPYTPGSEDHADATDPATWRHYAEALAWYRAGRCDGIGYVLTPEDGMVGIDLDRCRDVETGIIAHWALEIIRRLDTYAEVSPSGTGVRIWARAAKPGPRCKTGYQDGAVEMYGHSRYLTVTGHRLPDVPATIETRQTAIEWLYALLWPPAGGRNGTTRQAPQGGPPPMTDGDILRLLDRAKNAPKWRRLYAGDTAGYPSASEADMAAACLIVYYTRDTDQILRIIRGSRLERDKWDRQDYADRTIAAALDLVTEQYTPRGRGPRPKMGGAPPADSGGTAPPGDSPPDAPSAQPTDGPPPAVVCLRDWLRTTYEPTFRRGRALYSARLGREITAAEISASPPWEVLARLAALDDHPRPRGSTDPSDIDRQALPQHYRTWLPVAWGDLAADLPEEAESPEVVEPAREDYARALSAALLTMVPLAWRRDRQDSRSRSRSRQDSHDGDEIEVQRRPLIEWAALFGRGTRWQSVRGYRIWSRMDRGQLRIAIRAELLSQVHSRDLAGMTQRRLTDLCVLYGLGCPCHVSGGGTRATELTTDYLADLLAQPEDAPSADPGDTTPPGAGDAWEPPSDPDTQTDAGGSRAPACEAAS